MTREQLQTLLDNLSARLKKQGLKISSIRCLIWYSKGKNIYRSAPRNKIGKKGHIYHPYLYEFPSERDQIMDNIDFFPKKYYLQYKDVCS